MMHVQEKFYKRENLCSGVSDGYIMASGYDSHVGIRVSSRTLGALRMQLTAEEAEILAAQLVKAAAHLRKRAA